MAHKGTCPGRGAPNLGITVNAFDAFVQRLPEFSTQFDPRSVSIPKLGNNRIDCAHEAMESGVVRGVNLVGNAIQPAHELLRREIAIHIQLNLFAHLVSETHRVSSG
jgi:hypothetical protein